MNDDILITKGLTKHYKNVKALDNININIKRGKIYGLVGKNGAGKTTLMRIIAGLTLPSSGTIELFGCDKSLEEKKKINRKYDRSSCILFLHVSKRKFRSH